MSKVTETSKTLQQIEEGQGDIDVNLIVAEVFEDIRRNPGRYRNQPDYHYSGQCTPCKDDGTRHDGPYLVDVGGSVLILGPEDPQGLIDLVRYLVSSRRRRVRMKFPVDVNLNEAQTKTFEELMEKVTKWRERRDLNERIDRFRQEKTVSPQHSGNITVDGNFTIGGGGPASMVFGTSSPAGQITFNSSGDMLITDGSGKFQLFDPTAEF